MMEECHGKSYEERLRIAGLTTLETRRVRADLIEVYKILNELENVEEGMFFERYNKETVCRSKYQTRGNDKKLFKKRFRLDVARYSFGHRVIQTWNSLPNEVVNGSSVNIFKGKLDRFLGQHRGFT